MKSAQASGRLFWAVPGAILAVAVGVSLWSSEQQRQREAEARAVSVLPPGVQKRWEAYVARRLAKVIARDGSQLRLTDFMGDATVVSINMPYTVSCEVLGTSIDFGSGDDVTMVTVFGATVMGDTESEPALGVDKFSVAADRLNASLCEVAVAYMRTITEP